MNPLDPTVGPQWSKGLPPSGEGLWILPAFMGAILVLVLIGATIQDLIERWKRR